MTFGSLFSGIGGIDLGLERAGFECRYQVEIDPYCRKVLEKHWPDVKRYGDITKVDGRELEPVDLVAGGFPCQDLSQAGKRAGIEGTRSGLWFEFSRLVRESRPRYVLVENVAGLLVYDGMRRVVGELAGLGYVGCWRSLRASEFGASHLRKRVFIVAYRQRERGERRGDAGILGVQETEEHREALQREWNGHAANDSGSAMAYTAESRQTHFWTNAGTSSGIPGENGDGNIQPERYGGTLGHAERARWTPAGIGCHQHAGGEPEAGRGIVGDTAGVRCGGLPEKGANGQGGVSHVAERYIDLATFAPGPSDLRWPAILRERPDLAPALGTRARPPLENPASKRTESRAETDQEVQAGWIPAEGRFTRGSRTRHNSLDAGGSTVEQYGEAPFESPLCRVADGTAGWMDGAMSNRTKRLGRLGNAVVPDCVEWIGRGIREFEENLCRD